MMMDSLSVECTPILRKILLSRDRSLYNSIFRFSRDLNHSDKSLHVKVSSTHSSFR